MADKKFRQFTEKHRKFSIDLTESGEWEALNSDARLVFLVMWNSVKVNTAGIYRGSPTSIKFQTNIRQNPRITSAIKQLESEGLITPLQEGGWLLKGWFRQNCSSPEFALSAIHSLQGYKSVAQSFISENSDILIKRLPSTKDVKMLLPNNQYQVQVLNTQDSDSSLSRNTGITDTGINAQRVDDHDEFQRVAQSVKDRLEFDQGNYMKFEEIVTRMEQGNIQYEESLCGLAELGLTGVEIEELWDCVTDDLAI